MENGHDDAGRDAEPVSRDKILRHEQGQVNIDFPCSAGHEQDWQPFTWLIYIVVVDSHIQRIVLTNEETRVTQQVSHRPHRHLSNANLA